MPVATTPPAEAWTEWGGDGSRLVFTHANGFPPESYRTLLTGLTRDFEVASFANRPLWSKEDPERLKSWNPMACDLQSAIDGTDRLPVVAVGHSLGGVLCALAAARDPSLFFRIVLLDPVVFTGARSWMWLAMKRLGLGRRFPLASGAARRRDRWPDRESVRASWSGKRVFQSWRPEVFDDYLDAGLVDAAGGTVRLRYPREWEARVFEVCPHSVWRDLRRVRQPVLVIRGETSDTLTRAAARRMARDMPDARLVEVEGTSHFLPMERPEEVAGLIRWFAAANGVVSDAAADRRR